VAAAWQVACGVVVTASQPLPDLGLRPDLRFADPDPAAGPRGGVHRRVGAVVAVRPAGSGAEVDVHVTGDMAWQRLADRAARVDISCAFTHAVGPDPFGGRVERIDIS
jgi:hypothetical protein